MTPELRSWYLSNLGIVQYLPKGEEPAALAFHTASDEMSEALGTSKDAMDSAPSNLNVTNSAHKTHKAQLANVLGLMDKKEEAQGAEPVASSDTVSDSTAVEKINDQPPVAASPALSFRLACWHPSDDILVFNQLPVGEKPEPEHILLLSKILKAIGRLPSELPAPELFDWPMETVVGQHVDHSESGAKDMLSVFLAARIKKYGVLWVLLMGELPSILLFPQQQSSAEKPLSDEENNYTHCLGKTEDIPGGAKIIVVRSLQEMLADSGFKAETWQAIRHLAE